MAGDLQAKEGLVILGTEAPALAAVAERAVAGELRVLHNYGDRVRIVDLGGASEEVTALASRSVEITAPEGLTGTESLGIEAFRLRSSSVYAEAKRNRPRQGEVWNLPEGGCATIGRGTAVRSATTEAVEAAAAAPTSAYLEGSVAVGIVIVEGPTAALQFSADERTKVIAEVQNGLTFLATSNPAAGITFAYAINIVRVNVQPDPNTADREGLWRNPAMEALGYVGSWDSVSRYVEDLRQQFHTRWAYCAFFTKYPLDWFAYASIGGPRLIMDYNNDGWGPDNIDRVFAHETGHIFMCPDEYASSGCDCGGSWGRWGKPNVNCENCAPAGGTGCLMRANEWAMCTVTPAHLGWMPGRLFAKHSGKALDVSGASTSAGGALIQWTYHGGQNQQFRPDPLGDGSFRLVAQHSGLVLDVSGASTDSGAQIIQWTWHGGDNQRFGIEPLGDGSVRIVAKHSGKVLDVSGASNADGAQIIQWDWHGGDNQRWFLTAPIVVKHSGQVLDVSGASTDSGATIIQWPYHGYANQLFRVEPVADGFVRFVAVHSGKVLDVYGASTAPGAQLIQWDWNGGDNQLFRLEPLDDGTMRIVAKHSGQVLDVTGASGDNGVAVIQWPWNAGANQRWLVPQW